jgi:hypothetical protein
VSPGLPIRSAAEGVHARADEQACIGQVWDAVSVIDESKIATHDEPAARDRSNYIVRLDLSADALPGHYEQMWTRTDDKQQRIEDDRTRASGGNRAEAAMVCRVLRSRAYVGFVLVAASLSACTSSQSSSTLSSSRSSSSTLSAQSTSPSKQAAMPSNGLGAALALAPRQALSVRYTDWAAYAHQGDPQTQAFAAAFVSYDALTQPDLGFRSVDAEWEADIKLPHQAAATVLQFSSRTDLAGVEAKLIAAGYHKTRSGRHDVLNLPGGITAAPDKPWTLVMSAVAIDNPRHLLAAGVTTEAVNSIFVGPALGARPDMAALIRRATGLISAVAAVGDAACPSVGRELVSVGKNFPIAIMNAEQKFAELGHFTPFTADLVGLTEPAATAGTAERMFPDSGAARANATARVAAPSLMNELLGADTGLRVASSSTDGPVLHLALHTSQPGVLTDVAAKRTLGFDVCPEPRTLANRCRRRSRATSRGGLAASRLRLTHRRGQEGEPRRTGIALAQPIGLPDQGISSLLEIMMQHGLRVSHVDRARQSGPRSPTREAGQLGHDHVAHAPVT